MRARSAAASVVRHVGGLAAEALLAVALVATLAFAAAAVTRDQPIGASAALAGKGGHAASAQVTLSAAPAPATLGQVVQVSGSGYDPTLSTWVRVETSTSIGWYSAGVDAQGAVSAAVLMSQTGSVQIAVYQTSLSGKSTMVASCWLTVS